MDILPKAEEKRLVLRLLGLWRAACRDGRYPSSAGMAAQRVAEIWDHSFVLDLTDPAARPVFREAGPAYAAHADIPLIDLPADRAPAATLVANSLCCLNEVLRKRAPVSHGGSFRDRAGDDVLFRTILLPLSDDGASMTALLGAANCRKAATQA